MKVVCEYCGSYVEADENMRCPLCVAELGSSVKAEQDRLAKEEEAERQREAEEKAQEAKEEHVSEVIKGVAGVAAAVVAGLSSSNQEKQKHAAEQRPSMPREGFEHHARFDGPGGPGAPDGHMKHARQDFPEGSGKHSRVDNPGHGDARHAGKPGGGPGPHRA